MVTHLKIIESGKRLENQNYKMTKGVIYSFVQDYCKDLYSMYNWAVYFRLDK